MERNKRIILISHCILNQNSVVYPLARAKGAYKDIIIELINNDIGIHQLPCPEYRYLGLKREPMTKEQYDNKNFRNINKRIANDTVIVIKEYLSNGYEVLGIIGINESPTCGINGNKGILMEELIYILNKENIQLKHIDVPTDYYDGEKGNKFMAELNNLIK
ncbi:CD3072 family TudS-related putative desulfidase [Sedimentibacter sp.]|uniref:CD3072 family TudS-related putative desulfidase n=1 Tax=Sedimentibacter sp. TaxID=1960295 RepID=UPI0028A824CF|nr:CD3072 family TudS-related putative desulfidase [Sedimentibacter sp.]